MRAVVQRVTHAKVTVDGTITGEIERGLLVLAGFHSTDTVADLEKVAGKIVRMRIFPGEEDRMDQCLLDMGGGLLAISQFTLYGDMRKGNRPSFSDAAPPDQAREQYEQFCNSLETLLTRPVQRGIFGADMKVELVNDGPVTIVLDSAVWAKG